MIKSRSFCRWLAAMAVLCSLAIVLNSIHLSMSSNVMDGNLHEYIIGLAEVPTAVTRISEKNSDELIQPKQPQLLLNVPFYVYEDLAWVNATLGGYPLKQAVNRRRKHSLDYWFMVSSLNHPLRTRDPSQAKLFVVPLLLNLYSLRVYHATSTTVQAHNDTLSQNVTMCWNNMCDKTLLKYAASVLNSSVWFHRNEGLDHIAVTSHYGYRLKGKLKMPPLLRKSIYKCHSISYEDRTYNDPSRKSYPSLLVGNGCPQERHKTHQVAFIGTLKDPTIVEFHDRQNICRWVHELDAANSSELQSSLPLVSICGKGAQCPALALAKFGFHVRGDTFGSQRLMDALLSGTVPLITRVEQYNIVPQWINWTEISYFVNISNEATFRPSLLNILYAREHEYEQRHQAVLTNRDLFDWSTLVPFDTYMYMLQADLYPETRHSPDFSNQYSALMLP